VADAPQRTESGLKLPRLTGSMQITQRAVALLVVVGLLVISYVGTLRIYLDQQSEMASAHREIAERQATIAKLEDELARWSDPSYIKTQARERLGWVMPGEVGYRVIGSDGAVVSGEVGSIQGNSDPVKQAWYERLWSSVQAADQPAVVPTTTPLATVSPPAPAPSASTTKKR
jgi:cell division protein FtsB